MPDERKDWFDDGDAARQAAGERRIDLSGIRPLRASPKIR
jgi:hypothetical protein